MSAASVGRACSVAVVGLRALLVTVEAQVAPGLPGFQVIGSSGAAARQAADRVRAALGAIGVTLPARKVLVSLAPADVPKAGARFDLAVATAVLEQLGVVGGPGLAGTALLGELALDGAVRPVPGALPCAARLPAAGLGRVLLADADAPEAALVDGVEVVPVATLQEAVEVLRGERAARAVPPSPPPPPVGWRGDLADVRGQPEARRALEVAAAGGHHLLLLGPPGCGKSMLARRLPSILPPLTRGQALEVAAVRSVVGRSGSGTGGRPVLDLVAPFRAPHHRASVSALLGGGSGIARPGELSLAHRGVLFLDELFEWPRAVLDSLREPLEDGVVRVSRAQGTVTYPAVVQLVGAANPCPCGGGQQCICGDETIWAYRGRLSGPLADRLDLAPAVLPLAAEDLLQPAAAESSATVRARVVAARTLAAARWADLGLVARADPLARDGDDPEPWRNADVPPAALRPGTTSAALRLLARAVETGDLTGRGYDRTLRVARTCADLEGTEVVGPEHVDEAWTARFALRRPRTTTTARVAT